MNIQLRCEVVLSKKLEKLIEQGESIEISIAPIRGNRAEAILRLVVPDNLASKEFEALEPETSLILRPPFVAVEAAPDITSTIAVTALFGKGVTESNPLSILVAQPKLSSVSKTAEIKPVTARPSIMSYEELVLALGKVKNIEQALPTMKPKNGKTFTRDEAQAYDKLLVDAPRLPFSVYVSNDNTGLIEINDLQIGIKLNTMYDLSGLPAKTLRDSRDLRTLLLGGYLTFRSEKEFLTWITGGVSSQLASHPTLATGSRAEMEILMETGQQPSTSEPGSVPAASSHTNAEVIEVEDTDEPDMDPELAALASTFSNSPTTATAATPQIVRPQSESVKTIRRR